MKKVFVSIITFNGAESTDACLDTLEQVTRRDSELHVIVIDNASTIPYFPQKKHYKNFTYHPLRLEENSGFSGGHNHGMKFALEQGADYVIILNNDTTVDAGLIDNLIGSSQSNEFADIVSPKIYFSKGSEFHKNRYETKDLGKVIWYAGGIMDWDNVLGKHRGVDEIDTGQYDMHGPTDFTTGCCMLVRKEVIEKIGLFDERYFLYYEDSDFNQRAKKAGFGIYYEPGAIMWHKNAESTGGSGSLIQDYFITRNRLLFGMQYARVRTKAALFRESVGILRTGRMWQQQGVKDYYRGNFGKGSFAL